MRGISVKRRTGCLGNSAATASSVLILVHASGWAYAIVAVAFVGLFLASAISSLRRRQPDRDAWRRESLGDAWRRRSE
jgi:hypothetical protein